MKEFRVIVMSTNTHSGSVFHYKVYTDSGVRKNLSTGKMCSREHLPRTSCSAGQDILFTLGPD